MIPLDVDRMLQLLPVLEVYKPEYSQFPMESDTGFHVYNNWFGPVDAEVLYSMVRLYIPSRIIEVGSGMSTLCMAMAIAKNAQGQIVSIDPEPRVAIAGLDIEFIQKPVQDVPRKLFKTLKENDILFIDSSHIYAPDGDIDVLYNSVLPALAAGVIVHIHDIFLPSGYPAWWDHRGYDEQSHLVRQLETGIWDVLWASHAVHLKHPEALRQAFKTYRSWDYPGSFWMQKR